MTIPSTSCEANEQEPDLSINFEYMLDFGPRANTNAGLAASDAARSLIFYLLSLLLFVKALIGELPKTICPGVFPVAMVITTVGSFSPLQSGSSCLHAIAIVLAAPCFPVDLFSVLVGDVLTSLVKPLQDLGRSALRNGDHCTRTAPLY